MCQYIHWMSWWFGTVDFRFLAVSHMVKMTNSADWSALSDPFCSCRKPRSTVVVRYRFRLVCICRKLMIFFSHFFAVSIWECLYWGKSCLLYSYLLGHPLLVSIFSPTYLSPPSILLTSCLIFYLSLSHSFHPLALSVFFSPYEDTLSEMWTVWGPRKKCPDWYGVLISRVSW